ncbi:MAG: DUF4241 domain-containing protein, partial [Deltaproteobacteria bacterium]|nr:DUF4241 domain-containing protein [Deltaproteobacteria bacterium]
MVEALEVHTDFEAAFTDGALFRDSDGAHLVSRVSRVGMLPFTTKALTVGDPTGLLQPERPPCGCVAEGSFPVDLAVVSFVDGDLTKLGHSWNAVARLLISDKPVTSWVPASHGAQVSSGWGCFLDAAEPTALPAAIQRRLHGQAPRDGIAHGQRSTWDGRALMTFSAGSGNGDYKGWWGINASGKASAYCLDFELLLTDETQDIPVPWPSGRGAVVAQHLEEASIEARVPWLSPNRLEVRHP